MDEEGGHRGRIADDADPSPGGQALSREDLSEVEELVDRVRPDHSGLSEHLVKGVRGQGGGAHDVSRRQFPAREIGLDDDDRFDPGDAAGDAGELARVADRLEVESDGLRVRVLLPILEDVIAGHIGAVARGDEGRDPQAAVLRRREQRGPERARLAEESQRTRIRQERGQGGVEGDIGGLVDEAERIRAHHAHSVGAGRGDHSSLQFGTLVAGLGEARGDDEHRLDPVGRALLDHLGGRFRGNRDHGEIRGAGKIFEGPVRLDPCDLVRLGVDDPEVARELRRGDVADEEMAGGVAFAAGADDHHRGGVEDRAHAQGLGPVLPRGLNLDGSCRRIDVEVHGHDTVVETARDLVAGGLEDLQHRTVLRQHLGGEPAEPQIPGSSGEMFEEDRADAATLVGVGDVEGHLGGGLGDLVEAPDSDDVGADEHDHRHPIPMVDVDEPFEITFGQAGQRGEEAQVDGLRRLSLVHPRQGIGIGRDDGAQMSGSAVAQDDIGFPAGRIVFHAPSISGRRESLTVHELQGHRTGAEGTVRSGKSRASTAQ